MIAGPQPAHRPLQERWEVWSPKGTNAADFEMHQEAAYQRKRVRLSPVGSPRTSGLTVIRAQMVMATKAATLAKNNNHALDVAERQKVVTTAALTEMTNTAKVKQAKADATRNALLQEQVGKASQDVSKARELSHKSKEEMAEDTEQKRLMLETNLKSAAARRQALISATTEKAGSEYTKACQMSAQKKQKEEQSAAEGEDKLGNKMDGASRRRESYAIF